MDIKSITLNIYDLILVIVLRAAFAEEEEDEKGGKSPEQEGEQEEVGPALGLHVDEQHNSQDQDVAPLKSNYYALKILKSKFLLILRNNLNDKENLSRLLRNLQGIDSNGNRTIYSKTIPGIEGN